MCLLGSFDCYRRHTLALPNWAVDCRSQQEVSQRSLLRTSTSKKHILRWSMSGEKDCRCDDQILSRQLSQLVHFGLDMYVQYSLLSPPTVYVWSVITPSNDRLIIAIFPHSVIRIAEQVVNFHDFYSASALLAMQSAVLARGIPSVRLSIRLSFRYVPVLCPDEWRYDRAVLASGRTFLLVSSEIKFIRIFAGDHIQRGR